MCSGKNAFFFFFLGLFGIYDAFEWRQENFGKTDT